MMMIVIDCHSIVVWNDNNFYYNVLSHFIHKVITIPYFALENMYTAKKFYIVFIIFNPWIILNLAPERNICTSLSKLRKSDKSLSNTSLVILRIVICFILQFQGNQRK